jgi:hypothetical protein
MSRARQLAGTAVFVVAVLVLIFAVVLTRADASRQGGGVASGGSQVEKSSDPSPMAPEIAPTEGSPAEVPLDPVAPPEVPPGPCQRHIMTLEFADTTVEQDMEAASSVVIGSIEAIGAAQWNAAGGRAPTSRGEIAPTRVMRLVKISVEETLKGSASESIVGYVPGGQIGCHEFHLTGFPLGLRGGERFVMFMSNSAPRTGLAGVAEVWQMWPVDGDTVTTRDGKKPLSEILQANTDSLAPS